MPSLINTYQIYNKTQLLWLLNRIQNKLKSTMTYDLEFGIIFKILYNEKL